MVRRPDRRRIVEAAFPLVERQLELERAPQRTLADFADHLAAKLDLRRERWTELGPVSD